MSLHPPAGRLAFIGDLFTYPQSNLLEDGIAVQYASFDNTWAQCRARRLSDQDYSVVGKLEVTRK